MCILKVGGKADCGDYHVGKCADALAMEGALSDFQDQVLHVPPDDLIVLLHADAIRMIFLESLVFMFSFLVFFPLLLFLSRNQE